MNDEYANTPEEPVDERDAATVIKTLYQELADKEHALLLAAQFGKSLIEEKEDLEKQIEFSKQDQLNKIEYLEQESYELRRQMESMRNEYEAKIYELSEDLHLLNKTLLQKELNKGDNMQSQHDQFDLLQELNEKNEKLTNDIKQIELSLSIEQEANRRLESRLKEKEALLSENAKRLSCFQKETNRLLSKQQEIEYALMQATGERDKQSKLIEELTKKYIFIENEKNDIEHLIYERENDIFNLRRMNQELIYKFEKLDNMNLSHKRRQSNKPRLGDFNSVCFFNETQFGTKQFHSMPFGDSSFEHRNEMEAMSELDIFKLNEIEEDEDALDENNEGDESVDMYSKPLFDEFIGAINWQQEQKLQDEQESQHVDQNTCPGQFRSMEEDSNNSVL